ncbi:hypothetical protein BSKO_05585 [Bryopsis sp. KO-2023]|nr:hypothetical protein BSKO_05585 [Bryopsis sp. KO-2023]
MFRRQLFDQFRRGRSMHSNSSKFQQEALQKLKENGMSQIHHHYWTNQNTSQERWFPLIVMSLISGFTAAGFTLFGVYQYPRFFQLSNRLDGLEETKWKRAWYPAAGLGALGLAAAGVYSENSENDGGVDRASTPPSPPGGPGLTQHFIADAACRAAPAVVNITVHQSRPEMPEFFGKRDNSSGSGFIFGEEGLILTNYHVVSAALSQPQRGNNQASVLVSLQDGRVFEAELVNFDKPSDLALVQIHSDDSLPTVKLGHSGSLRVGEWVLALGSPLHLRNSVTAGIISCVDRKAKELGLAGTHGIDYIQTDAAINQGNSGGPLVNLEGEVIGVNNMKVLAADGVSFAIPVDTAKEVISQLLLSGRVLRPYLGIKMLPINPRVASQLKKLTPTFPDVRHGILVPEVTKGSPAERGGLQPGDVIVGFKGCREEDVTTGKLIEELGKHIGKSMELRVLRGSVDGKQHLVTLHVIASRVEE